MKKSLNNHITWPVILITVKSVNIPDGLKGCVTKEGRTEVGWEWGSEGRSRQQNDPKRAWHQTHSLLPRYSTGGVAPDVTHNLCILPLNIINDKVINQDTNSFKINNKKSLMLWRQTQKSNGIIENLIF